MHMKFDTTKCPLYAAAPGPSPKVVLRGKGLREAELDRPAYFTIDGREAGPGESFTANLTHELIGV